MRLLSFFLIASCAANAQQTVATGINVRPNAAATAGGYINIYNAAATAYAQMRIQGGSSAIEINGMPSVNGNIVFNPGNVSTKASVHILSPSGNTTDPALILWDGGSSGTTNGILMKLGNGTDVFKLDTSHVPATSVPSATFATQGSSRHFWFTGSAISSTATNPVFNFEADGASPYVAAFTTPSGGSWTIGPSMVGYSGACCSTTTMLFDSTVGSQAQIGTFDLYGGSFSNGRVRLQGSGAAFSSWVLTLPVDDGTAGQCLSTDGTGITSWASCGAGSAPPFVDTTSIVKGSVDATKLLAFEVDGFTTATTRTLTPQNASYTIAGTNIANIFSATQTMSADVLFGTTRTYDIGSFASQAAEVNAASLNACMTSIGCWTITANNVSGDQLLFSSTAGSLLSLKSTALSPIGAGTMDLGLTSAHFATGYINNIVAASYQFSSFSSNRCLATDASGFIAQLTSQCVLQSRTINTTSPLGGGGDLSADRTLTCTTCVTTAGGQTIGGTLSMTELRISGNTVINTSGILSNSFGVDVNAGVAGTGFNIHGGASGVTSTTCSQFTGGICTAP